MTSEESLFEVRSRARELQAVFDGITDPGASEWLEENSKDPQAVNQYAGGALDIHLTAFEASQLFKLIQRLRTADGSCEIDAIRAELEGYEPITEDTFVWLPLDSYAQECKDRADQNREAIWAALKGPAFERYSSVRVTYSGESDDGQINNITLEPEDNDGAKLLTDTRVSVINKSSRLVDGEWIESPLVKDTSLDEALEDFAYDWLSSNHGGWENNDGGSGHMVFDFKNQKVNISHCTYYTSSETDEYVL